MLLGTGFMPLWRSDEVIGHNVVRYRVLISVHALTQSEFLKAGRGVKHLAYIYLTYLCALFVTDQTDMCPALRTCLAECIAQTTSSSSVTDE